MEKAPGVIRVLVQRRGKGMFCVSSEHDYLLSSRITWLYIPSSRPCSTLTSGEAGPGLTTGGSPNLGYVKLPNLEFLTQPERALCLSSHCTSYSAKSLSNLLLFLLLVIDRKPWVCRAAVWGYNWGKLLTLHEVGVSWWFQTGLVGRGVECWFPVDLCLLRADKTTLTETKFSGSHKLMSS